MKLRALWWWIDRWRQSTAYIDMTLEEQGAYRNLLDDAALRGGPLPDDEHVLAKACGDPRRWPRVRTKVMTHFALTPDGWRNTTLDEVLQESARRATNQANYRKRRSDNRHDNAANNGAPTTAITTPILLSPSPDKEQRTNTRACVPESFKPPTDPFVDPLVTERAGRFVERYARLYPEHRHGARYAIKPARDYQAAVQLCATWVDDARLDKLAICFLTTDHQFAESGSRTLSQFLALASWVDGELAKWEAEHQVRA